MSEALPNNTHDPNAPDFEARSSPPVHGKVPAWEDPAEQVFASDPPTLLLSASDSKRGFTLERGGRNGMTDTAERIGSAMGTAQRHIRRRLELVRRSSGGTIEFPSADSSEERAGQSATELASSKLRQVQGEVTELQRKAARRMDEWSEQAGEHFQQIRREVSSVLSLTRERAQELAHEYPLQTIAASAGVCFALGMALRIRRSHRG